MKDNDEERRGTSASKFKNPNLDKKKDDTYYLALEKPRGCKLLASTLWAPDGHHTL